MIHRLLNGIFRVRETECMLCGEKSNLTADCLKICVKCIREKSKEAFPYIMETHMKTRSFFGLPSQPPKTPNGIPCNVCANECKIGNGEISYCGIKRNVDGRLKSLSTPKMGLLYSYLDSQVTNCCAAWFCPAGTTSGYPQYTYRAGPEYGYYNLAIFFYGCNFDCLFCQNTSHKNVSNGKTRTVEDLVTETKRNPSISCWCFFGGSSEPQLPFAIKAARTALKKLSNRIMRICFEWNGCGNPQLVRKAAELSLISGGNIKFDLKAFNPTMSYALSGVSNKRAFENFRMIANDFCPQRPEVPLLTATTLLVPGYVDAVEVEQIAEFIANLNPEIPYSLLVFHPDFMMTDMPITPLKQVVECYKKARKLLKQVHVGNLQTLNIRNMKELETKIHHRIKDR